MTQNLPRFDIYANPHLGADKPAIVIGGGIVNPEGGQIVVDQARGGIVLAAGAPPGSPLRLENPTTRNESARW